MELFIYLFNCKEEGLKTVPKVEYYEISNRIFIIYCHPIYY